MDSSSTYATISANYQRKVFYAEGLHWLFYCNGSHILYVTSKDGVTWNSPTVIREGISSSGLSVWYDGNVHYAYASGAPGAQVVYVTGKIIGGTIEWNAEEIAVPGINGSTFTLTNEQVSPNMWALESRSQGNTDLTTSIITGKMSSGTCFLFEPGQEVRTSIGTNFPIECTRIGWRTPQKLNVSVPEGTWKIITNLNNKGNITHSGCLFLRLWKLSESDGSQAKPLTAWIGSDKTIFSSTNSESIVTIWATVPRVDFDSAYLFIECGWKVETSGSTNETELRFECGTASQVATVTYEYYNGYVITDSSGCPWIDYIRNDGLYWESCVASAKSSNGTSWNLPTIISEPSLLVVRTSILPLNEEEIYAVYAKENGINGRLWNGTAWLAEEKINDSHLVQDYGFSTVTDGYQVYVVALEQGSNDILFSKRSANGFWTTNVVETNQDSSSFPVLSLDKSNYDLYCFWLHNNTLYGKRYVNEGWTSLDPLPSEKVLSSPGSISCFYQVSDGKIGIAWTEQTDNAYNLKYGVLTLKTNSSNMSLNASALKFLLYASQGCGKCQEQINLLKSLYGNDSVVFYDIFDDANRNYYNTITTSMVKANVFGASDSNRGLIPLTGVFKNSELIATVSGPISSESWQSILNSSTDDSLRCYLGSIESNVTLSDRATKQSLAASFAQTSSASSQTDDLFTLVPLVSVAAAIDAINPCELNAFLILLVYVFYQIGKKDVLKVGLAFTSAVFISYYLMGLGVLKVLQSLSFLTLIVAAFGLMIGLLEVAGFFGLQRKHVPDSFSKGIRENLKKVMNPYTAFLAGILVSFFLLPCTSGSYFVALDLLAKNATFTEGLFLLVLYNTIVVFPFLVMTIIIYTLTFKTSKVRIWLDTKEKWLRLFSGVTMIFISLILVL